MKSNFKSNYQFKNLTLIMNLNYYSSLNYSEFVFLIDFFHSNLKSYYSCMLVWEVYQKFKNHFA